MYEAAPRRRAGAALVLYGGPHGALIPSNGVCRTGAGSLRIRGSETKMRDSCASRTRGLYWEVVQR